MIQLSGQNLTNNTQEDESGGSDLAYRCRGDFAGVIQVSIDRNRIPTRQLTFNVCPKDHIVQ